MDNISQNVLAEVDEDQPQQRGTPDMERIRNARKRRILQLKRWTQYDKAKEKEEISRYKKGFPSNRKGPKSVRFSQNLILLEAGNHGDTDEVRRLLSEGVCADVANSDGLSALHQCAINKNIEMCRVLLNYSANVNAKDKELWTPLHAAAVCGHTEICLLLIRSGADLLAINTDGNMPYDICEDEITLDAIENEMAARGITQDMINEARQIPEKTMLRDLQSAVAKYGVSSAVTLFTQYDKQGANCMHVAAACGYGDVTRYLVSLAMPVDLLDRDGWQPIHVAAVSNQLEIIEILLTHGANIDATNKQGETIYELVYDNEMYDKLMLLKREMEKLKDSKGVVASVGLVRRRSSTNPRSASIRRTSMKEKSFLSWKEARQEAELRMSAEGGLQDNNNNVNNGSNNHIEEFNIHSSLRNKHKPVPETIAEVDCNDQECDLNGINIELEDSKKPWPLAGLSNGKELRGSFTHAHPYNSPTRDPDTFPYTPAIKTTPQTQSPALHQQQNLLSKNNPNPIKTFPEPKSRHTITGDKPAIRNHNATLPHSVRGSSQENLDARPPSIRTNLQSKPTNTLPRSQQQQSQPSSNAHRSSVNSVKTSSTHTTPIGSVKSSSQLSLHRTPPAIIPRDDGRKQIVSRYQKRPKSDSCCTIS